MIGQTEDIVRAMRNALMRANDTVADCEMELLRAERAFASATDDLADACEYKRILEQAIERLPVLESKLYGC